MLINDKKSRSPTSLVRSWNNSLDLAAAILIRTIRSNNEMHYYIDNQVVQLLLLLGHSDRGVPLRDQGYSC